MRFSKYFHRKVWFWSKFNWIIATPGRANFLLKQGAKLKRRKVSQQKHQASLELLKRDDNSDEEEKNIS